MEQIELENSEVLGPYWRSLSPRVRGEILTSRVEISTLGALKLAAEHFAMEEEKEKHGKEER